MKHLETHCFDKDYPEIGGIPFVKLYTINPVFVKQALNWISATKNFGKWKEYCVWRIKHNAPTDLPART